MQALDLIVVTYNRLDKLKKSLQCYVDQTHYFRNLIVVDNCSTDGTKEYLDEWEKNTTTSFNKIIVHTKENLGGSGGFYLGQKKAMKLKADWVFVADDDAYADPNMVEEFYAYLESHDMSKVSAVCAAVLNMDGSVCLYHRKRHKIVGKEYVRESSRIEEYSKKSFSIDDLSYVGSFLNARVLRECGLVNPDYFIYYDDTEHSVRLKKYGDIVVVPAIKIIHEGGAESSVKDDTLTWHEFYFKRNMAHLLLKHYPMIGIVPVLQMFNSEIYRILHGKKYDERYILKRRALFCAFFGILGKDKKYKPGWHDVMINTVIDK